MSKPTILNRMFGVAVLAMMFGAASVHAQSGNMNAAGQTPENKAGGMSPTGQNETSSVKPKTSGASETAGSSASGAASGSLSKSDQNMMKELAQANMAEIEAAKLAQQKSNSEQVKNFAQKMIDDHTKASEQLQQLAQAKNVTLPTQLDAKHKAEIDKLASLSGDKFDKMYMSRGGVRDHRQAHALLSRIEKNAKDSDLKTLASNMMPTINDHWKMAKEVRGEQTTATGSSGTKSHSKSGAGMSKSSGASSGSSSATDASGKTSANRAGEMSTTGQNETSSVKPSGQTPGSAPGTGK